MMVATLARWCLLYVRQSMSKWAGSTVMPGSVIFALAVLLIIGLVETYEVATQLYCQVLAAQALVWLIFASSAGGVIFLLYVLTRRGANEISRAHRALIKRKMRSAFASARPGAKSRP